MSNNNRFVSVCAMATLLWVGCATTRDPLEGWRTHEVPASKSDSRNKWNDPRHYWNLDEAITKDYKSYIENLPHEERRYIFDDGIFLLEDGTGKHAIRISYYGYGFWSSPRWNHVLIYDTNNMRIKTIKYKSGYSMHH